MPSHGIDEHRALLDQELSRSVEHQHRLMVRASDRRKPHGGTHQRLGDGFGIHGIMFIGF